MQRKVHIPLYLNAENKKYTWLTPALKISLHMLDENLHMASQTEILLEQINNLPVQNAARRISVCSFLNMPFADN
jgi:hypothetical protein